MARILSSLEKAPLEKVLYPSFFALIVAAGVSIKVMMSDENIAEYQDDYAQKVLAIINQGKVINQASTDSEAEIKNHLDKLLKKLQTSDNTALISSFERFLALDRQHVFTLGAFLTTEHTASWIAASDYNAAMQKAPFTLLGGCFRNKERMNDISIQIDKVGEVSPTANSQQISSLPVHLVNTQFDPNAQTGWKNLPFEREFGKISSGFINYTGSSECKGRSFFVYISDKIYQDSPVALHFKEGASSLIDMQF